MKEDLKWNFESNPNPMAYGLNIEFNPANDALAAFITNVGLSEKQFPEFIESVIHSTQFANQYSSFMSFNLLDEQDKDHIEGIGGIKEGEVYIRDIILDYECVMSEKLFSQVAFDYGSKLLEVRRNHLDDHRLSKNWVYEMEEALARLIEKIL
jgi:hypothetical protein